ncbi:TRAP transporter permease [Rhodoferax sediminis]|jgi:TRAP transporter 4TM/12TM fusion protein|uniref:TRAP transporter permease n=1 Tax=Rhodoferax sediminis TaxID=2509614 RepID=A0A515DFU0_9BURK|nr:TRAP transporter permease [Rhodoferax sediminis]QDL39280.1 TRAP transporter permease [Rhodoferax sediminis]
MTSLHTPADEFQEHGAQRTLSGTALKIVIGAALTFSTYQLIVAGFSPLSSLTMRSLHVGFLLLLTFLMYPALKSGKLTSIVWYDWLLAAAGFALSFYHWIFEADLIQRSGDPTTADLVVGTIMVVLVFEATRRILGLALPLVCGTFLLYGLFGQYLPGPLSHRAYGFDQIVNQLWLGTEGILGIPVMVSATYIFLFILFGAFLEHAGMIKLFNSVALGLVGRAKGGPAKVAVISSGFMGTISGSGVANVLTVGQFTIPLMKRFGYSSIFAGAVEATSSMGGQIMPPVMGAVAFIMAETLNVPYVDIVKAAVIPAILYYVTAFWIVHLEAGRMGLVGLPKDQCPSPVKALKESWYLVLPLAGLVGMLFHGFTPMFAGLTGLALTVILILGAAVAARLSGTAFRYVFWLALGLAAASFVEFGIYAILAVIALLVLLCFRVKGGRDTLRAVRLSLIDGARQALPVGVACAVVGVIIGVLTLTGAASSFAGFILTVGEKSLFLSLFLTMIVCLILGMGIPTIPNYIITSSIAAPALLSLGVPLIVSHMFVFYFGIMADLTPPVALAAFAAASIAKASPMRIGFKATQIAIAGFVIPYMAVYTPALMLQGHWTVVAVLYIVGKALLAIALWGATAVGYLLAPLRIHERVFTGVAALMLVTAGTLSDQIGFVMAAIFVCWHVWQRRRLAVA